MRLRLPRPSRRNVLAGLGGVATSVVWRRPDAARGQARAALTLRLAASQAPLRGLQPPSPTWDFVAGSGEPPRLCQGDGLDLTLVNDLPVPVALNWRGGDGAAAIEPLAMRPPLLPGQSSTFSLPLLQAGTVLCDARLLGDGQLRALPATAFAVIERQPVPIDADHLVTIADWRVRSDGSVVAPGVDPGDAAALFTVNGHPAIDVSCRVNSRLRFRFINGCQRSVIAIKIDNQDVRVMAIDGQPAEPFVARGGQLLLAPGTRIDAFVDVAARPRSASTIWLHDGASARPIGRLICEDSDPLRATPLGPPQPLPSNGLPERVPLASAQRVELSLAPRLDGASGDWQRPLTLTATTAPAFRAKRDSSVVLSLTNPAATASTFHLHGHHVRWLDRLDDGWKPFWLDTLLVPGGQTVRLAFVAEHPGAWLMETMGTDWSAPRLARWYVVD
ncbi:MAG: multicopper oxidase family protein [Xanthobacteraceae bacterium]